MKIFVLAKQKSSVGKTISAALLKHTGHKLLFPDDDSNELLKGE